MSAGGMFADEARAKETKRRVWLPADDIITMMTVLDHSDCGFRLRFVDVLEQHVEEHLS